MTVVPRMWPRSPWGSHETFQEIHKGHHHFHRHTRGYVPFSLSLSLKCVVQFLRRFVTCHHIVLAVNDENGGGVCVRVCICLTALLTCCTVHQLKYIGEWVLSLQICASITTANFGTF